MTDKPNLNRISPAVQVMSYEDLAALVKDLGTKQTLTTRLEIALANYSELVQRYNDLHGMMNRLGRCVRAGEDIPAEVIALWEAMRAADHQAGRPWAGD